MKRTTYARKATARDAKEMARIFYDSFTEFNLSVGLPPEWPSQEFCLRTIKSFIAHPGYRSFVAVDTSGKILGSNFLEVHDFVAAPGPISVEGSSQNSGAGRLLMDTVLDCARELGKQSIQGVQLAQNIKSYGLYASMGFVPREQLVALQGFPLQSPKPSFPFSVRAMQECDAAACDDLFMKVNGYSRLADITLAAKHQSPWADPYVIHCKGSGVIAGYTTGLSLLGHMCCATEEATRILYLHAAQEMHEQRNGKVPLIHLPGRLYPDLLQWVLSTGVKILRLETLISIGYYNSPSGGIYCPSMAY